MSILEVEIEQRCKRLATANGCELLKIQNARGWPDRLLLTPHGEVVWMEFKRPKGVVAPLQQFFHQKLRSMRFQVHVVYSETQFQSILAGLLLNPGSHTTTNEELLSG